MAVLVCSSVTAVEVKTIAVVLISDVHCSFVCCSNTCVVVMIPYEIIDSSGLK